MIFIENQVKLSNNNEATDLLTDGFYSAPHALVKGVHLASPSLYLVNQYSMYMYMVKPGSYDLCAPHVS